MRVNPRDNVAIAVSADGLARGTVLPEGVTLREAIPQSHKVTLVHLGEGAPIIRYGEVIGYAARDIPARRNSFSP